MFWPDQHHAQLFA